MVQFHLKHLNSDTHIHTHTERKLKTYKQICFQKIYEFVVRVYREHKFCNILLQVFLV